MAHRRTLGSSLFPAALVGMLATPAALAEESILSLDWSAPAGCPAAADVRAQVEALLGTPPLDGGRSPLAVRGSIEVRGERSVLHLSTSGIEGRGERTLEGASCREVTSAGAVVIALAIDPDAVAASQGAPAVAAFEAQAGPAAPVPNAPAAAGPPPSPVQPASPSAPEAAPNDEAASASFSGELGLLVDTATLPGLSAGPSLGGTLLPVSVLSLTLEAAYVLPRFAEATTGTGNGKGADVALASGALSGCARLPLGEIELGPCGGVEAGALLADGRGFRSSSADAVTWLGLRFGLEARMPISGPLGLRARAGGVVALLRPGVQFRSSPSSFKEIHTPADVSGRFSLALSWLFW